ncbi:ADR070Wp [Eremothecium gossypii ATCC 10895]|uniref:ADR070Wp n=1 Tax=Eremothecium gossypii (strain ATCC 10895 / CBS 109.51 / FGSC 9923 / NRRL Y-1056) TaxID=284811 RepID=Q75A49_EREGS|nr:ADR070Wp [Eremothecium gossypii ATCC 10895]AAS51990.2 ADR070Wp [Eremothecium gossypii ATCC 10895]
MSNRLNSLGGSNSKPGLKFKPKVVARKSKEERDAATARINAEEKPSFERKKYTKKPPQQRRLPRYLENTKVITSGPLAAGNFSNGGDSGRPFFKVEGSQSKLLQQGLLAAGNDTGEDGSDQEDYQDNKNRINMGKETKPEQLFQEDEESDVEMDADAATSRRVAELFPVRAVRVRHEELESSTSVVAEAPSDSATPATPPAFGDATLDTMLRAHQEELRTKLDELHVGGLESAEVMAERKKISQDHRYIKGKLDRLDKQPGKFLFFQLPSELPEFRPLNPKPREPAPEQQTEPVPKTEDSQEDEADAAPVAKPTADLSELDQLAGNIGSLRIHKSGMISVRLGDCIMDVVRGAEFTFLQDVIALDNEGQEIELLGQVDGRVVVTPHL